MPQNIIGRGAEAILIQEEGFLVKDRIKKSYRLPSLDEKLRKQRTKKEAKLLEKASSLIPVPKVIKTDEKEKIEMEFIEGKKLSGHLDGLKDAEKICEQIGENTAKLHDADIIHGDLTTSNMIYVENSKENSIENSPQASSNPKTSSALNPTAKRSPITKGISNPNNISAEQASKRSLCSRHSKKTSEQTSSFKVFFIDFGLGFTSKRIEDKAVDLHLLRQALEAKHFQNWQALFAAVLKGYNSKDKTLVLEQLKKVESRGRYKKGF